MFLTTKRNRNAKRGIEPIVAAILLIAIAIVAGIILYLWVSRLISSGTTTSTTSIAAQIQVLQVQYDSDKKQILIFVQAPGLSQSDIKEAMIFKAGGQLVATCSSDAITSPTNLGGDVYKLTITVKSCKDTSGKQLSNGLNSGIYYVELVTTYGTVITPAFTVT